MPFAFPVLFLYVLLGLLGTFLFLLLLFGGIIFFGKLLDKRPYLALVVGFLWLSLMVTIVLWIFGGTT